MNIQLEKDSELHKEMDALKREVDDLKSKNADLTIAYNVSKIGIWDWDTVKNILEWDDQMYVLYGIKKENFSGAYDAWANGLHPDDRAWSEAEINLALEDKKDWNLTFRVRWPDGSIRYIRATGKVFWDENKKPVRMLGMNWDVTQERKSEEMLRELNSKLNEKNQELSDFTHIASHDLQEPVNTIIAFSDLLLSLERDQMGTTVIEYVDYINKSAHRSKILIQNLLDYSRLGSDRKLKKIDLNAMVNDVKVDLANRIDKTQAVITVDKLPVISVFELELRLLFQNLIANAIKFMTPDTIPRIHISCVETDINWEFSVQDNGIGVPLKHKKNIFAVFRRLHSKELFEGTGIGLAHCKKIAELHDGKIWVESKPNSGSIFKFTISNTLK
jgi:signal transduction histidine kinase